MRTFLIGALAAFAFVFPALAQNPGVTPSPPITAGHCASWVSATSIGDSGAACSGTTPLTQFHFYIGNVSNLPVDTALAGDCVYGASGIICTKTNGVAFTAIATAVPATTDLIAGAFSSTTPSYGAIPSCSAAQQALTYNTSTHAFGCVTLALPALTNTRLAKIANYTAASADCGDTIALGGSAFFTLTLNAASGYTATCSFIVVNEDTGRGKTIAINGITNFVLWPLQSIVIINQNNVWQTEGRGRWILSGTTHLFADITNGSDTNDGLAAGTGGAFQHIQTCIDTIIKLLDLAGQQIDCSVAVGTYTENMYVGNYIGERSSYGFDQVKIFAANATCSNTILAPTVGNAVFATGQNPPWQFIGFQVQNATSSALFETDSGGFLALKSICFGSTSGSHMLATLQGRIAIISANYSIVGGGSSHMAASYNGLIYSQGGLTVTLTGTPAFSAGFLFAQNGGNILTNGQVWSGSATGPSYNVQNNSIVDTSTNAALPGNATGNVFSGGVFNGTLNASQQGIANHAVSTQLSAPVASSCGSGPGANGTDTAGFVTTGSGATACTITFNQAWNNAPQCIVQSLVSTSLLTYSISASAINMSSVSAGASYYWHCIGLPGG